MLAAQLTAHSMGSAAGTGVAGTGEAGTGVAGAAASVHDHMASPLPLIAMRGRCASARDVRLPRTGATPARRGTAARAAVNVPGSTAAA